MVQGLAFLSKKSWHTKNISNQEKVWMAEQQEQTEQRKTKELARQIQQEREHDELDRIAAASGKKRSMVRDRGIDWMYQGGTRGELAQKDEENKREEFLLGKEFVGKEAANGDFNNGAMAKEGINNVVSKIGSEPAHPDGVQPDATANQPDNRTQNTTAGYLEPSVKDRNESFRLRVEDPMFSVTQTQREREDKAEKNRDLYDRVLGPLDDGDDDQDDAPADRSERKLKKKQAKKEKKRERKHKKHKKKSRKRRASDSDSDLSSYDDRSKDSRDDRRRGRDRRSHKSSRDDRSRSRSHSRSRADGPDRQHRSPKESRDRHLADKKPRASARTRSRSRSNTPECSVRSRDNYDRKRPRTNSHNDRDLVARRQPDRRSRSRNRSRSVDRYRHNNNSNNNGDRYSSSDHHHRHRDHHRGDSRQRNNYRNDENNRISPRHGDHDYRGKRGEERGNSSRAPPPDRKHPPHNPDQRAQPQSKPNVEENNRAPDRSKYGLRGSSNSGTQIASGDLGPDRDLLRKRRDERESEKRRLQSLTSSRQRVRGEDRKKALEEMERDARARKNVPTARVSSSNDDVVPASKNATFLHDVTRSAHGISGEVSLQTRVSQNRSNNQRLHDSFL